MVLHDQHIHSCYSEDSTEPIISHYNIAKIKGCKYFVTTEHAPTTAPRLTSDLYKRYEPAPIQQSSPIEIVRSLSLMCK